MFHLQSSFIFKSFKKQGKEAGINFVLFSQLRSMIGDLQKLIGTNQGSTITHKWENSNNVQHNFKIL